MAGNSRRSLVDRLDIRPGARALFVDAPEGYEKTLGALPEGVKTVRADLGVAHTKKGSKASRPTSVTSYAGGGVFDFIQCFCRSGKDLALALPGLKASLDKSGMLWLSWPKRAALSEEEAEKSDTLDESMVRTLGLRAGLVDLKVCAVDETWSGVKFVVRLRDR